jgi:putative membrane protein
MPIVIPISRADHARISAAIKAAERKTAAEIVCVLARRSSDYAYVPALWAAVAALSAPWPMILFTSMSVRAIYLTQIVVFIVAALIFSWSPIRFALTPRFVKRERVRRAAVEQFYTRGVANTKNRSGVLIFASLAERRAHILADEGISAKVDDSEWRRALDLLLDHVREKRIADGYIEAIAECATILSKHAPPDGENDLPDKIYVM